MTRTSQEVAVRAMIFGALGFRASLEVTEHPRAAPLCSQLLRWFEQLQFSPEIQTLHREILETPHGELSRESQTEAYWRGEAAAVLGWAVQLNEKPDLLARIDTGVLVTRLRILQPDVWELVSNARLRSERDIQDYCAFCIRVRHQHQLSVLDADGQATLRKIQESRMNDLGLAEASDRVDRSALESLLTSQTSSTKGLYLSRAITAEWLLGRDE